VFCTAAWQAADAANVRLSFRAVCTAAGIGPDSTPRHLRHTFVSLMSDSDVAVAEIARLVGRGSGQLLRLLRRLARTAAAGSGAPAVRVTFPAGSAVTSGQADLPKILSAVLGREVTFAEGRQGGESPGATAEEYSPDVGMP
jgi:hypothetical protein